MSDVQPILLSLSQLSCMEIGLARPYIPLNFCFNVSFAMYSTQMHVQCLKFEGKKLTTPHMIFHVYMVACVWGMHMLGKLKQIYLLGLPSLRPKSFLSCKIIPLGQ
uniref:Uncharacterized protein n=1 Tax=Opuntia streptacantha TaxID=393608 RepID=A0A7C8YTD3_OPUST